MVRKEEAIPGGAHHGKIMAFDSFTHSTKHLEILPLC
jgi:hypothetical protein